MLRAVILIGSHAIALALGFAAGIYALPILTAPPPPAAADLQRLSIDGRYKGEFRRDLKGSDFLHWGEGSIAVGPNAIALRGKLAPGPDYKLYLSPEFVETEPEFERHKPTMVRVGDVKTFENFVVTVPAGIDIERYNTVIVWCESFSQFISAAKYR